MPGISSSAKPVRRGADLEIRLTPHNDVLDVELRGPDPTDTKSFEGALQINSLADQRPGYDEDLEKLRIATGNTLKLSREFGTAEMDGILKALEVIYKRGRRLLYYLTQNRQDEFVEFCRRVCKKDLEPSRRPLVFVRAFARHMLPFEIIPIFNVDPWPAVADRESMLSALERFPSFSSQVVRVLRFASTTSCETEELRIRGTPAVPVRFFQNKKLTFVKDEWKLFSSDASGFVASAAWPEGMMVMPAAVKDFCTLFWEESGKHQIHHFCCHFYASERLSVKVSGGRLASVTPERLSEDAYLELSSGTEPIVAVRLRDIVDNFLDLKKSNPRSAAASAPLIFMNACGTSDVSPTGVISLPSEVLKHGYRGFIGTESKIPDQFASEFAKRFYNCWLKSENSHLSEALLEAKRAMFREFLDPLGIFYSEYGEPDLYISNHELEDSHVECSP